MKYIPLNADQFIEYDVDTNEANIVSKSDLERQLQINQEQLDALPPPVTDGMLLAWARDHYQDPGQRNREVLEPIVADLTAKLEAINAIV